jgi:hypothetical protein
MRRGAQRIEIRQVRQIKVTLSAVFLQQRISVSMASINLTASPSTVT